MKKLSILFILSAIFISAAFSHPTIPKTHDALSPERFIYISDNCQNLYTAYMYKPNEKLWEKGPLYHFKFTNKSLISDIEIEIIVYFNSEKEMDEYVNAINTTYIEQYFSKIRSIFKEKNLQPQIIKDSNGKIKKFLYEVG